MCVVCLRDKFRHGRQATGIKRSAIRTKRINGGFGVNIEPVGEVAGMVSKKRSNKMVYVFGGGSADGGADMDALLGGKGANLAEMASIGLPVPPGFTITTDVCAAYNKSGRTLPDLLKEEVLKGLSFVTEITGRRFGHPEQPLLVAVRSGAKASMPGMMDTILNLGLNDETVAALIEMTGDARFVYDSYRRFIQMYSDVVLGVGHGEFEDLLENYKNLNGFALDTELNAAAWLDVIAQYNEAIERNTGHPFPQDVETQLWGAIGAVFESWDNVRAQTYRQLHHISDASGTAVNVQAMVFGNRGEKSATGVAFTRDPSTGAPRVFGEYLINAQGEDVVAGIRTPLPLLRPDSDTGSAVESGPALQDEMPETFSELMALVKKLEAHYCDMQDIEFTVQEGRLWLLQTRSGKRTVEAGIRIAVDMANEGLLSRDEALLRVAPSDLDSLLHPTIDDSAVKDVVGRGLPASPGAASGEIVLTADDAESAKAQGRETILVRLETSPEDIHGMHAAVGILTARGGMTSHAAVVARGMGRPCVVGASALRIDEASGVLKVGKQTFKQGDVITIDGGTGRILRGAAKMKKSKLSGAFATLMSWADARRTLKVRANAETPRDVQQARDFGAEGIGLCRTEHMFFDEARISAVREMICADDESGRRQALAKIAPMQRDDFAKIFEIMAGLPVTIRFLDPPLHEFLPTGDHEVANVAGGLGIPESRLRARIRELSEINPMLGLRGARLAIAYPEITEMQARAVFEAAAIVHKKNGSSVHPEIMLPLVAFRREFDALASVIRRVGEDVAKETGQHPSYEIGTMVELPRACLVSDKIASGDDGAEFFSFGTNDLTQTCLGLSRDDSAPIMQSYMQNGVLDVDPFVSIDQEGVGVLMRQAISAGRSVQKDIQLGVCGEHGGDPSSIDFFQDIGLDYVSCSPYRVPVARLAAAHAAIKRQS